MEYQINHTPFEMKDISDKLFNSPFLSDVTFLIEGKPIYAHSLELMKRSSVFQIKLQSISGANKFIRITDYGYDIFYQFIRFIYTDNYTISSENHFELLKLAKTYNVIRLINVLLNYSDSHIEKLDFCVVENHEIALNCTKLQVAYNLNDILKSDVFLTIYPDTVEEILKLDQIKNDVTEIDIVDALVRWLNHQCVQNQIPFSECRKKFDNLIRLVRFPVLTIDELNDIKIKYPDLLSNNDLCNICEQKKFGPDFKDGRVWNCVPRAQFIWGFERKPYSDRLQFKTTFLVSSDMILAGFVFGRCSNYFQQIDITISCQPTTFYEENEININGKLEVFTCSSIAVSLGSSIRLRPKYMYTIGYKIHQFINLDQHQQSYFCSRGPQTELIINAPLNSVKILAAHETMHEIFFLRAATSIDIDKI